MAVWLWGGGGGGVGGHRDHNSWLQVMEVVVGGGDLLAGSGVAEQRGQGLHRWKAVASIILPPLCRCCPETS